MNTCSRMEDMISTSEGGLRMTIEQERNYISKHPKYKNSPKWIDRVMRMPDPQVHAIYKQFQKVDYKKLERELKAQEKENANYHQINMFEYMEGETP